MIERLFIWTAMWFFVSDAFGSLFLLAGAVPLAAPTAAHISFSLAVNFGVIVFGAVALAHPK